MKIAFSRRTIAGILCAGASLAACSQRPAAAQQSQPAGAATPFVTIEAEAPASVTTGQIVRLAGQPRAAETSPELEASGRAYVALTATGQSLTIPDAPACNAIVIRNSIPDAPEGGGIRATLSLYVNGKKRQELTLSSLHNWLYGGVQRNGQSNNPSVGEPHVFWDEAHAFITGGVPKGASIMLRKDSSDSAAFYHIDLVDLEQVGPPLAPPAAGTYLNVKDAPYSAYGDGVHDDTEALQRCIDDAKAAGKSVWIPAGTYIKSAQTFVRGVQVRGAGMWYTSVVVTDLAADERTRGYAPGFRMTGNGPVVQDLHIDDDTRTMRGGGNGFSMANKNDSDATMNWLIKNVWVEHTTAGAWLAGCHGRITGCRIRDTYADAITLNSGASDNLIDNNSIRGCGDDGIAVLSEAGSPGGISVNDTYLHNTVTCTWWGHNCDIAGGYGHVVEGNYLADNAGAGVFTVNLPRSYPMAPLTGAVIRDNVFVRGGGNYYGQRRGAVWMFTNSSPVSGVSLIGNEIVDPLFSGIQIMGAVSQSDRFEGNRIINPGAEAVSIEPGAVGKATFADNIVIGLKPGLPALVNKSTGRFTVDGSIAAQ